MAATVTADLRTARQWVYVSPGYMAWAKAHAHRTHRRAWTNYLAQVARSQKHEQNHAKEINLSKPRLTAYDIT